MQNRMNQRFCYPVKRRRSRRISLNVYRTFYGVPEKLTRQVTQFGKLHVIRSRNLTPKNEFQKPVFPHYLQKLSKRSVKKHKTEQRHKQNKLTKHQRQRLWNNNHHHERSIEDSDSTTYYQGTKNAATKLWRKLRRRKESEFCNEFRHISDRKNRFGAAILVCSLAIVLLFPHFRPGKTTHYLETTKAKDIETTTNQSISKESTQKTKRATRKSSNLIEFYKGFNLYTQHNIPDYI